MIKKIPVPFTRLNHTWVQTSVKWARSLLLGHTRSSSPGFMVREQWNKMMPLYSTANRFDSSLLRAQMIYLCPKREREHDDPVEQKNVWPCLSYLFDKNQEKKTGINTSSSLSVILLHRQYTHTCPRLCKSAESKCIHRIKCTFKTMTLWIYIREVITYILYIQAHLPRKRTCQCIFLCSHFPFIRSKVHSWRHYWAVI